MKVNFYDFETIEEDKLRFAVIMAKFNDQWIFVRHKQRNTWEIPGGHREKNEHIKVTASRELFEETGAIKYNITPLCVYSVIREGDEESTYTESYGGLFYAEVEKLEPLPSSEIGEVNFFKELPKELTYPLIQPFLFQRICEFTKEIDIISHRSELIL